MIDIMLRGIVNNAVNIDKVSRNLKKSEGQLGLCILLVTTGLYVTGKVIIKQGERIKALENAINDIKSKGE